jgi:hypothetical protein
VIRRAVAPFAVGTQGLGAEYRSWDLPDSRIPKFYTKYKNLKTDHKEPFSR